jgi:septal ring-binding cell division protein DamX
VVESYPRESAAADVSKIFEALKEAELASRSRPRLAATPEERALAVFVVHETKPQAGANEAVSRGTPRYLVWFLLGIALMSAAFIFLRHYARGVGDNRQAVASTSAGKVPGVPSLSPSSEQSTSVLPATLSSGLPGFVLQVAVMKHEDNADALADTLYRRNFPAFVFRRGADPFYRVVVGVYGDAVSAGRTKDELEKQGFKTILRPWSPR